MKFLLLFSMIAFADNCPSSGCNNTYYCQPQVVYKTKYIIKKVIEKAPPVITKEIIYEPKYHKVIVEKDRSFNNRIRLLGGTGPTGSLVSDYSDYTSLDVKYGMVFGVGYDRMILKHWSVGAAALSNKTLLLDVGFDF